MAVKATRTDENPEEYVSGVPNRDLTDEEWDALEPEQQDEVIATGLWDVEGAPVAAAEPEVEPPA